MLVLPNHSASNSLTMLSYDREAGMIVVKTTHPTDVDPETRRVPLAQFLNEVGIPFRAVRDVTRTQQGVWREEPDPEPSVA